ncbi:hypothetical protein MMAD_01420 [Mycolicibacterium madagascariense]|uniref:Cell envelope protein n=1 Tax=Mycolicibacterium madagascariense TaxID=212765 RepID=A0A7I7XAC1_9MYCO|nr:DUF1254 domain-containing protein [Mycolicibacterium madagascariense]MCV7013434.1 DUF1254 domain-containing protein [Mycolicibacterium madagascariense]BBZ25847.1 hypothetical protein MMAD_01420 [Mycolicibacterium madagascariense]
MTAAEQAREIAKEAYVYGFPLVDDYRIQYSYFIDTADPEYKGPFNQVHNTARVYTPADTAVQTPNSDTPYSQLGADLRAEPLVLTVPPVDAGRYYSLQFIDAYTYNVDYVGTRTTGNTGGTYLLAGPNWTGETPAGIDKVIRSDTDFMVVFYRTQLLGPDDLSAVETIQNGYTAQPLSAYLHQPAPPPPPHIDFPVPPNTTQEATSLNFFTTLSFVLHHAPTLPADRGIRERMASIGITGDTLFRPEALDSPLRQAFQDGMADARAELSTFVQTKLDTGEVTSADLFGSPAEMGTNYLYRMAGAALGIYGNTKTEAVYPGFVTDDTGAPLLGTNAYAYRFAPAQLPPVNAFWSLTMYDATTSLLVANPIDRYLINSPMLPDLVQDPDGGHTLHLQHTAPAQNVQANWLPTPAGAFRIILRLYWPKPEVLDGRWVAPKPHRVA